MPRKTKESDQTLENNLEYIGLNLSKIPNFLKQYESLNFRPSKSYDETVYKVYKYINIKEIQILITPCDRLTDIKERYKLASPIVEYLDSKSEDNIEKFATFLKMVSTMKKDRIEEIAKEQEMNCKCKSKKTKIHICSSKPFGIFRSFPYKIRNS